MYINSLLNFVIDQLTFSPPLLCARRLRTIAHSSLHFILPSRYCAERAAAPTYGPLLLIPQLFLGPCLGSYLCLHGPMPLLSCSSFSSMPLIVLQSYSFFTFLITFTTIEDGEGYLIHLVP